MEHMIIRCLLLLLKRLRKYLRSLQEHLHVVDIGWVNNLGFIIDSFSPQNSFVIFFAKFSGEEIIWASKEALKKNLRSRVEWNTNYLVSSQLSSLLLSGRASYGKIHRSEVRIVLKDSYCSLLLQKRIVLQVKDIPRLQAMIHAELINNWVQPP